MTDHIPHITCQMCMDLLPLVQDGIAGEDSRRAVYRHTESCSACRSLLTCQPPPLPEQNTAMVRLRRQIRLCSLLLLMFGILYGLSLTAGSGLFYNAIIMPLLGGVGYGIFRWKALYQVPVLLLVTHLVSNGLCLLRGTEHLDILSLLMWTGLYCIFAALGCVIAGLLHFALRKEP